MLSTSSILRQLDAAGISAAGSFAVYTPPPRALRRTNWCRSSATTTLDACDEPDYGIYEIAGRLGRPLYVHASGSPNPGIRTEPPYNDPYYLAEAIRRYPDAIFILGHAGWDSLAKKLTYLPAVIDLA
jgi:hypothetical protein